MIRLIMTIAFVCITSHFYAQDEIEQREKVFAIDSIAKTTFKNGDTLSVTIRNLTSRERGFTVEALSLEKEPYYFSAVYSAYFNDDAIFFRKLRAAQKQSREKKIQYVLPNYKTKSNNVKANSDTTINFITKGVTMKGKIMLRIKITSDLSNDDCDTIYSNLIQVASLPN